MVPSHHGQTWSIMVCVHGINGPITPWLIMVCDHGLNGSINTLVNHSQSLSVYIVLNGPITAWSNIEHHGLCPWSKWSHITMVKFGLCTWSKWFYHTMVKHGQSWSVSKSKWSHHTMVKHGLCPWYKWSNHTMVKHGLFICVHGVNGTITPWSASLV